jgi:hypothetical protein
VRLPALAGARLYYALVFEDIRRARLIDAIRYDADHLLGIELAAIGPGRRHGFTMEWHQTGIRSQEHSPRVTGFTNAAYLVGAPLGPDAESLYVATRIDVGGPSVVPWLEIARLASDRYDIVPYGSINRISRGEDEARYRAGVRIWLPITAATRIEGEAHLEVIDDFAFQPGPSRTSGGLAISIVWYPHAPVGRIDLN